MHDIAWATVLSVLIICIAAYNIWDRWITHLERFDEKEED